MASVQGGAKQTPDSSSYSSVLILGTITAASAFVITVLIVLLCMGCKRKEKPKRIQADGVKLMDMNSLRQTKLRSISKSDTRLHDINKLDYNTRKASKNRPASMDLLYLPNRRSELDLRCPQSRQLPKIPLGSGEEREHTYSEVRPRAPEDALYESVGGKNEAETAGSATLVQPKPQNPAQPNGNGITTPANTQAPDAVTAEYACIRKVRKNDKTHLQLKQPENGTGSREPETSRSDTELHPTHRKQDLPRKPIDEFHFLSFPKETVFMGNGEQYIWKPPEEGDISMLQSRPSVPPSVPHGDNNQGQLTAVEISEMYSKVCKPTKKRKPPASPPSTKENTGHRTEHSSGSNAEGEAGTGYDVIKTQVWAGSAQAVMPSEDPCYESISEKTWVGGGDADPAYETIDANWKRDKALAPQQGKKKKAISKTLPRENLYESISDLKQGATTSTTTIFTFNDGVEMYVTGL
ncbi:LIME1 protein, partial [Atractosteus spatula]|nr:LIME1 protein [Atractosteus spatula]